MLRQPVPKFRDWVNQHSGWIGAITAAASMLITLCGAYKVSSQFAAMELLRASELKKGLSPGSTELMSRQLDFIVSQLASGKWTQISLFAVLITLAVLIGCIVLGVFVADKANLPPTSYVLLTSRSIREKQQADIDDRNRWYVLVASIAGALSIGVVSNFAFYFILKFLGLPS